MTKNQEAETQQGSKRKSQTPKPNTTTAKSRSIRYYLTITKNYTDKNVALILEFFSGTSGRVQQPINYKETVEPASKKKSKSTPDVGHFNENNPDAQKQQIEAQNQQIEAQNQQPQVQLVEAPALLPLLERGQRPPMARGIYVIMLSWIYLDLH